MTTKTDLAAALRKVLDEHDHGALGGRLLEEALADAALSALSAPADPDLIREARTLAARKIEDSCDGEAVQIMLDLICDQLEAVVTVSGGSVTTGSLAAHQEGDARPEMSESSVVAYHQWRKNLGWDRLSDDEGTAARIAFYAGWDWARATAPEPEWEERLAACAEHGTHCWSCARHKERRRPAGPWEPLPEGETDE